MYKYLYAVGRYKDYQPGFHVVDIAQYYIKDLGKLFSTLYIVMHDSVFNGEIAIQLDRYQLEFESNPTMDIQEWLDTKSQEVLVRSPVIPGKDRLFVNAVRPFTDGYFHYPGDLNLAKDRQEDLFADTAPDILVKHYQYHTGIDYKAIADYGLFTVNGVFYRGVPRSDGLFLVGAGSDYIYAKRDVRLGALNFKQLGKVQTTPVTPEMLYEVKTSGDTRWKIKVNKSMLTGNRTAWLVLNGQLLVDDDIIYQVSGTELMFNPKSFNPMKHYQTYREYTKTPKLADMNKFDKYIKEALTKHNSFLVFIDNPTLGIEVEPLSTFHYPNVLHTENKFPHPVMLENGLFPTVYPKSYGIKQRLLNHDVRIQRNYPIETSGTMAGSSYNSLAMNQGDPGHLPRGYFFKVFGVSFKSA